MSYHIEINEYQRRLIMKALEPNSGHRDYPRLSCGVADTQLEPKPGSRQGCLRRVKKFVPGR
jgi:hypothetical protein